MKKLFLRTGLFAGLAMSTIALASCGGSNEVQLKDADGNTYKVAVTEDSDTVSKAMVLAAANATKGEQKQYAFSVDASVDAKITLEMEGIKGTITAGAKAFVGASIGKDAYKAYEMGEEGYAEADFTEATAALKKGLGFLATADANVKFSDVAVNEKSEVWADAPAEALAETKTRVAGYNGKGATAKVRAFLNDGTFYAERCIGRFAAKELADTEKDAEYNYYGKTALPLDEMSPMLATALHDFQTKSYSEFLEAYLPMLSDMGLPVQLPEELPTFEVNKAFFESDNYETITKVVKALGVKISAINGSNVTFAVDITGNEVKEAVKAVSPAAVLMLPADLATDKTILSVSVTMNAVKGLVSQVKVSTEAVDVLASVVYQAVEMVISNMFGVKAMVNHLAVEKSATPWDSLSGTFKFEANFKYDADVKVAATPNSNLTYEEMND